MYRSTQITRAASGHLLTGFRLVRLPSHGIKQKKL